MKKLFIAVVLMFTLVCSAFAYTEGKRLKDVGIPERVSFIQFDNGGRVTCEATNAEVSILVQTNESMFSMTNGNKIQFYVYEIKALQDKLDYLKRVAKMNNLDYDFYKEQAG